MNEPNMPKPTSIAVRFVVATPRSRIIEMSTSGCAWRALVTGPERTRTSAASANRPRTSGRAPAPRVRLADADQQRGQRPGEQRGAAPVDLRRALHRRLRDPEEGGDDRHSVTTRPRPEDPLVGEVVDDHAAEHEAGAAADAERRADQPDAGRDPLGRELVADDPEREREDRGADALDRAAGDQHLDRVRQRADQRAEGEQRRARRPASAPCRTCRRGGRGSGWRPMR